MQRYSFPLTNLSNANKRQVSIAFCQFGQTLEPKVGEGAGRQGLEHCGWGAHCKFSEGQTDKIRNSTPVLQ